LVFACGARPPVSPLFPYTTLFRSRISRTLRSTRSARPPQSPRSITCSKAPTWNQSSTSTDSPLTTVRWSAAAAPVGSGMEGKAFTPQCSRAASSGFGLVHLGFDPVDEHRQRLPDRSLLLENLGFEAHHLLLQCRQLRAHGRRGPFVVLVGEFHHRLLQLGNLHVAFRQ